MATNDIVWDSTEPSSSKIVWDVPKKTSAKSDNSILSNTKQVYSDWANTLKDLLVKKVESDRQTGAGVASSFGNIANNVVGAGEYLTGNDKNLTSLVTGQSKREQRKQDLENFIKDRGIDTNSAGFKTGKLVGDVVATYPVGGLLGKGATAVGLSKAAPVLESGGFTLGDAATNSAVLNNLMRAGGGAVTNGVAGALLDPNAAKESAILGAVLPVGTKIAGSAGNAVRSVGSNLIDPLTEAGRTKQVSNLLKDFVGKDNIDDVVKNLRTNTGKTEGFVPTVGQAANNGDLAALQRMHQQANPSLYQDVANNQNQALADAIRKLGGDDVELQALKDAREAATAARYGTAKSTQIPANPELEGLLNRPAVKQAIQIAKQNMANQGLEVVGKTMPEAMPAGEREFAPLTSQFTEIPAEKLAGGQGKTLLQQIKRMGGINQEHLFDITGEKSGAKAKAAVGLFNKQGKGLDDLASQLHDLGFVPHDAVNDVDGGVQWLRDAIRSELEGNKVHALNDMPVYSAPQYIHENPSMGAPNYINELPSNPVYSGNLLHETKMALDKMANVMPVDAASNAAKSGNLSALKDFTKYLDENVPYYELAKKDYAKLSKPINQMELGNYITGKYIPAQYRDMPAPLQLNRNAIAKILQDTGDQAARKVSGFKGATLENSVTPEFLNTLKNVAGDEQLVAQGNLVGRGIGSPTFQHLSMSAKADKQGIANTLFNALKPFSIPAKVLSYVADKVYQLPIEQRNALLADVLKNPQKAAGLLETSAKAAKPSAISEAISKHGLLNLPAIMVAQ